MNIPLSHTGFKFALTALAFLAGFTLISSILFIEGIQLSSVLYGLMMLIVICIGVVGLVASIRGLNDPNSLQKILGLFLNLGFLALVGSLMLANVTGLISVFGG